MIGIIKLIMGLFFVFIIIACSAGYADEKEITNLPDKHVKEAPFK